MNLDIFQVCDTFMDSWHSPKSALFSIFTAVSPASAVRTAAAGDGHDEDQEAAQQDRNHDLELPHEVGLAWLNLTYIFLVLYNFNCFITCPYRR